MADLSLDSPTSFRLVAAAAATVASLALVALGVQIGTDGLGGDDAGRRASATASPAAAIVDQSRARPVAELNQTLLSLVPLGNPTAPVPSSPATSGAGAPSASPTPSPAPSSPSAPAPEPAPAPAPEPAPVPVPAPGPVAPPEAAPPAIPDPGPVLAPLEPVLEPIVGGVVEPLVGTGATPDGTTAAPATSSTSPVGGLMTLTGLLGL